MAGVPSFINNGPWWWIFVFLFLVVCFRSQFLYWLGRSVRQAAAGTAKSSHSRFAKVAQKLDSPKLDKARNFLEKYGAIGIIVSYFMVGFHTLLLLTVGYTKTSWAIFSLASIPGGLGWAALYSTVGMSFFTIWKTSPLLALSILIALIACVILIKKIRNKSVAQNLAKQPQNDDSGAHILQ